MTNTIHDWQSPKVVEALAIELMTEIESWRRDNTRKGNEGPDRTDLMRAIVFAGEKLDGFQMARFLEDSRLWPADQALVMHLRMASRFRQTIIDALNAPPAPPVVEGDVRVGIRFSVGSAVYEIEKGPNLYGEFEIRDTRSGQLSIGITRKTIQDYIDAERKAMTLARTAPSSSHYATTQPNTANRYPAGTMFTDNVWNYMVLSGPDRAGDYSVDAYDGSGNHQGTHMMRGSAITHHLQQHGTPNLPISVISNSVGSNPVGLGIYTGMTFKGDSGIVYTVRTPVSGGYWESEHSGGKKAVFSDNEINDFYNRNGPGI